MGRQGQTFSLSRHAKMFSVQHKILIWREDRNRTSRSSRSGVVHGSLVDDTHQSITPSTPISPPGTKRYSLEIIDSRNERFTRRIQGRHFGERGCRLPPTIFLRPLQTRHMFSVQHKIYIWRESRNRLHRRSR